MVEIPPAARRVHPARLEEFCTLAMVRSGMRAEEARLTAQVMVTTDTWGVFTHGSKQLRLLLHNFRQGRLDPRAVPMLVGGGPGWALFDGHYAMPMVTSCLAMETAIAKAKDTGIAYTGVFHSSHFGAAGYYAQMAAQQGLIGLAMCNVDPGVTVPGARGKVLGTNPLAFAIPAGEEKPVFLDIATSAVAASKLFAAKFHGQPIPGNWLVDDDGLPTTDPSHYPEQGALLPMAGHKGYGLALLVEVLTAVLTGAAVTWEVKSWVMDTPEPTNEGHAFIAIDANALRPGGQFGMRMDALIREIRSAPKAKGAERIYLPGEMEWERREQAMVEGIPLPDDVVASLTEMARDAGLDIQSLLS
jgi:ureidoglycolate dehydrogenase (NAD+)